LLLQFGPSECKKTNTFSLIFEKFCIVKNNLLVRNKKCLIEKGYVIKKATLRRIFVCIFGLTRNARAIGVCDLVVKI